MQEMNLRRVRLSNFGYLLAMSGCVSVCAMVVYPPAKPVWAGTRSGNDVGDATINGAMTKPQIAGPRELNRKLLNGIALQHANLGGKGCEYYKVSMPNNVVAHLVIVELSGNSFTVRPYISETVETTTKAAQAVNAIAAWNAGFFNLSDGESTSYITIDGRQVCEPKENKALIENVKLKPFLKDIFNRDELRFLKSPGGTVRACVQPHNEPVEPGYSLLHAVQGGPRILPGYAPRVGAFVRTEESGKVVDSIGTSMPAARTAVGIIGGETLAIVCVEGRRTKEFSRGCSLPVLAKFLSDLGCDSAINFDGGTSTTMAVRLPASMETQSSDASSEPASARGGLKTVFSSNPERSVKSVLYVVRN